MTWGTFKIYILQRKGANFQMMLGHLSNKSFKDHRIKPMLDYKASPGVSSYSLTK